MSTFNFILELPTGKAINQDTKFSLNGVKTELTKIVVAKIIKREFCKMMDVKTFKQYADEMNAEDTAGHYTPDDAYAWINSNFWLWIDRKQVKAGDWMKQIFEDHKKLQA